MVLAQYERQRLVRLVLKTDNAVFQASDSAQHLQFMESPEYATAYNTYKPKSNRPVCTHCGKQGHVVQKCYRIIGFPPGYKALGQTQSHQNKSNPRGVAGNTPSYQKAVANAIYAGTDDVVHVSTGSESQLPALTPHQLQSLIQQLQTHMQASEVVASCSKASISDKGVMASTSSSGNTVSLSSNLRFEKQILTFNHQCLSTLASSLSPSS